MIRLQGVRKSFGHRRGVRPVLNGVDLVVEEGELVVVAGRSGSGKTTLISVIAGLDRPDDGRVSVNGTEVHRLEDRELARFRSGVVGLVFQEFELLPHLSVLDNVLLPWVLSHGPQPDRAAARRRATGLLERVGLDSTAGLSPAALSGGEKQRLALARALFNRPRVLLCDEPTGNLDATTAAAILELLLDVQRDLGSTVLVATHDPLVLRGAGRVQELVDGTLGAPGEDVR